MTYSDCIFNKQTNKKKQTSTQTHKQTRALTFNVISTCTAHRDEKTSAKSPNAEVVGRRVATGGPAYVFVLGCFVIPLSLAWEGEWVWVGVVVGMGAGVGVGV